MQACDRGREGGVSVVDASRKQVIFWENPAGLLLRHAYVRTTVDNLPQSAKFAPEEHWRS